MQKSFDVICLGYLLIAVTQNSVELVFSSQSKLRNQLGTNKASILVFLLNQ